MPYLLIRIFTTPGVLESELTGRNHRNNLLDAIWCMFLLRVGSRIN